nr:YqaJ viral recombinase family protein [Luteibacter anthropi]
MTQGTPEWHAHRATHFNASDAPAMLGVSPYKTRAQLIRETATGLSAEIDEATQRRFDDGHRYEALARPLAEAIVGEELFPCVGEDGKFSASFDGLTMLGDVAFEHKSLNDSLRGAFATIDTIAPEYRDGPAGGRNLPEHYRVQMEHQCMVSGAERVLFMTSKWAGDELVEERHCWYEADAALRSRIEAGWAQFEADVAAYQPEQAQAATVVSGRAPDQLPVLRVEVTGMVTASNLTEFKENAFSVLGAINRDLQTDEDFANAAETVKWCEGVEEKLALTKEQVLSQTADIAAVFRTMDEVSAETRRVRLELDKLVKGEKERRRSEIVTEAVNGVRSHYEAINASMGAHAIQAPPSLPSLIGEAIKGKKTLTSIREAAEGRAATVKIEASQQADRVRANVAVLGEHPDHAHLFADRVQLCSTKTAEDLRNLVAARIAEHQRLEEARQEAERDRIRQEERAKLEREQAAAERQRQADERARVDAEAAAEQDRVAAERPQSGPVVAPAPVQAEAVASPAPVNSVDADLKAMDSLPFDVAPAPGPRRTVKLGDINARIAPLSITADGLAQLGFQSIGTERAAKLYAESDLIAIYRGMWGVIESAANELKKAA